MSSRSNSRPTTPLRRLSASSLRSLSLSHSRSRPPNTTEPPLQHLGPIFAELADAVADLAGNCEALDECNSLLDGWNESFASYLYGLRVNAYTAEFDQAPTLEDFQSHAERVKSRRPPSPPIQPLSPTRYQETEEPELGNETTFATGGDSEYSFMHQETGGTARGGRGGARGRGGSGAGGKPAGMSRREKTELMAFTDAIIQLLPITFREQQPQRGTTEKLLGLLRENPAGLSMSDLTSQTGAQTHRANESLTALVRAKIVIKALSKGVTSYRLDPNKYPPR